MPPAKKPPAQPSVRQRATDTAHARWLKNDRAIARLTKSLEAAQADLADVGGSLGKGAGALRKDVAKLLRDARRDVTKMSKAVRRDLEHLQKDLSVTPKARAVRSRPTASPAKRGATTGARRKSA